MTQARRLSALCVAVLMLTSCAELLELPRLKPRQLRFDPPQTTKIFDSENRLLADLHGRENRTLVALKGIPQHVRRAVVAIEDRRFFTHEGVDLKAILRAAGRNLSSGQIEEGGSTITQQLVRNTLMTAEVRAQDTIQRKLDEIALARQLENELGKREILERYLNTVYFGRGSYGIQAAANTIFGKPVEALSLAEAATLAGVISSPTNYDPMNHPKRARARRNLVIDAMEREGYIEPREARRARRSKLRTVESPDDKRYQAPYFVDYVRRQLLYDPRFKMLGKTAEERSKELVRGGLRVYTTLDLEAQAAAEESIASVLPYESDPYASLVAIDPRNGHVRAMVGGRDFFAPTKEDPYSKLNLAIVGEPGLGSVKGPDRTPGAPGTGRQAGSAFKPFALVTALEEGMSLSTSYDGRSCMDFPGADAGATWRVCNYDEASFGTISLMQATANSVNVVYAQLILDVGPEDVAEVAQRMGIRTPLSGVPSAALGTNAVNPLGMASAYGTVANNGAHVAPVGVTKIVDAATDKVLYEHEPEPEQVLEPAVAQQTTAALQGVITSGTGTGAAIGRPAAGKTGTAQEYRDAWFVGYTPELVTAVWIGYPQASIEMKGSCGIPDPKVCIPTRIDVTGGSWPASIWQGFMVAALEGVPVGSFVTPAVEIPSVEPTYEVAEEDYEEDYETSEEAEPAEEEDSGRGSGHVPPGQAKKDD